MSYLVALLGIPIAIGIIYFARRGNRRRPGLPAPDRAARRDCFVEKRAHVRR